MKLIGILLVLFTLHLNDGYAKTYRSISADELSLRDSITSYAQEHLGITYKYGGATTAGFDCSGFVYYVFNKFGIKVSRASSGYENEGEIVDLTNTQAGDIMLFTGTDASKRRVGHVGIVLKNVDGTVDFIHSSSSKNHYGVTISRYNASGYEKRFLRVINVIE